MVDIKICATPYKLCSFELSPVIYEDLPGHAKPVHNTLQEHDCCFMHDIDYLHCLHPLGEGVDGDK
jgi:hypothetical protein